MLVADKEEIRLKRSHIKLMKSPHTALYSGVMLLGESSVEENIPTACTDGVNKRYGRKFMAKLPEPQFNAVVLHENLHVALKHIPFHRPKWKEDRKTANIAADLVVNDIIYLISEVAPDLVKLPECAIWHPMFRDWSFNQIYDFLRKQGKGKTGKEKGNEKGKGKGGNPSEGSEPQEDGGNGPEPFDIDNLPEGFDEHDFSNEDIGKETVDRIDRALREGGILAGRMGGNTPRAIQDLLTPRVNWREALRDFLSEYGAGKDEFTWRRFNRRMLSNDLYLPSTYSEKVGELIFACDTSGSIGQEALTAVASEMCAICDDLNPSAVRVLWWDTMVAGEQKFEDKYEGLASLLKPQGGGGTRVSAVPEYIKSKNIQAQAIVVFTDGYVECDIKWDINIPTLWLITHNKSLSIPAGHKQVIYEE